MNIVAHDETLFIIVHQTYELWFKQILHELDSVLDVFKKDFVDEETIGNLVLRLRRVTEIQKVMIEQVRIMETMTPLDFLEFIDFLIPASGFQSFQFRIVENKLGLKADARLMYNKNIYSNVLSEEHKALMAKVESEISLFELLERWLERIPFLDFKGFNFLINYKKAVETMLDSDKQIIMENPNFSENIR